MRARVLEGEPARRFERSRGDDARQRVRNRFTRERPGDGGVLARGEDERQRGCPVAEVDAGRLAGRARRSDAVEDVVRDLERHSQRQSEGAQVDPAPAEPTGGLEELPVFREQRRR